MCQEAYKSQNRPHANSTIFTTLLHSDTQLLPMEIQTIMMSCIQVIFSVKSLTLITPGTGFLSASLWIKHLPISAVVFVSIKDILLGQQL